MIVDDQMEYSALRDTIRERGTARVWIFTVGLVAWASLTLLEVVLAVAPLMTLVPLLVLAGTFEAVLALHVGVERIGRYLSIFHDDRWEQAAGRFGRPAGALSVDPLFTAMFLTAAVLNALPAIATPPVVYQEWFAVFVPQAAFIARVVVARAAASRQRSIDAARFTQIRTDDEPTRPT